MTHDQMPVDHDSEQHETTAISRGKYRRHVAQIIFNEARRWWMYALFGSAAIATYVTGIELSWNAWQNTHNPIWYTLSLFLALIGASTALISAVAVQRYVRSALGGGK